jgi:putative nucleotidyltransferase with HDIG domain
MNSCGPSRHLSLDITLPPLTAALLAKDEYSGLHSVRVATLSSLFAEAVGLPPSEMELIRFGALVHDVGKIGVPDEILKSTRRLTAEEFAVIKSHPAIGRSVLSTISGIPESILDIALFHHERVDGKGYPIGLSGRQIPFTARLVAIADAWDAMTFNRTYRPTLSTDQARSELIHGAGSQFDSDLVRVFLDHVDPTATLNLYR